MATRLDYYVVLGVERHADTDEIKRAYRKLAMKYHPDRNSGDEEAAAKFKECSEAYAVLSDGEKRSRYDQYGHQGLDGMGAEFTNFSDIFEHLSDIFGFGFGGGGRQRRGPQAGQDLGMALEIDLMEAARGCKKTVTIPRHDHCETCDGSGSKKGSTPTKCAQCNGMGVVVMQLGIAGIRQPCPVCKGKRVRITDPCPDCRGQGKVKSQCKLEIEIPSGISSGNQMTARGEGEAGAPGAPRGDLIIEVRVKEHPLFQRDGDNLICRVPITFSQAALGGPIEVPTLDGPYEHNLKRGMQHGEYVRLAGKGMPNLRGRRNGDLIVVIAVETPKNLTKEQEELFRKLAELDHKHVSPERRSFFDKIRQFFTGTDEKVEQNSDSPTKK